MELTTLLDWFFTIFVLFMLFFLIYSRVKDQTLRDTWDEIVDLFTTKPEIIE